MKTKRMVCENKKTRVSIAALVFFMVLFGWNSIAAADAKGIVVVIDGINPYTILTFGLWTPDSSTYLYDKINIDQRRSINDKIGYVVPFYWPNNAVTCTSSSIASLASILRQFSDQNKTTGAPLVILAHSWGTVLAYITLNLNPDIVVDKLITLGSPLHVQSNPSLVYLK